VEAAVEAEVTRRLAERLRGEEEKRERENDTLVGPTTNSRSKSPSKGKEAPLPSGVLTPLLKRHKDLDDELKNRLRELEQKL
jgi:kinesin family protein 22